MPTHQDGVENRDKVYLASKFHSESENITESNSILIPRNHRFAKVCGKALWHPYLAIHCPIDVKNIRISAFWVLFDTYFGNLSRLRSPGFWGICFKYSRFAWFSWKVRTPQVTSFQICRISYSFVFTLNSPR